MKKNHLRLISENGETVVREPISNRRPNRTEDDSHEERIKRIRVSLYKINMLMADLKKSTQQQDWKD